VKEKFQIGNAHVSIVQEIHELEKVRLFEGPQTPREHRIPHDRNRYITTFCVV
jgi:hypothetical protein